MISATIKSRKRKGWLFYGIACVIVLPTNIAFWFILSEYWLLGTVAFFILALISVLMFFIAESLLVPSVEEIMLKDTRPPVVYLRTFDIDDNVVVDKVAPHLSVTGRKDIDMESFLEPLNAVGPLISIAKPGPGAEAGIYKIGAYRECFATKDWQATVTRWLEQAGMVIIAPGVSPGIKWELNEVKKRFTLDSVIILIPPKYQSTPKKAAGPDDDIGCDNFSSLIKQTFNVDIPPSTRRLYYIGFDTMGKVILPCDYDIKNNDDDTQASELSYQLQSILNRVRPNVDINNYTIYGQFTRRLRLSVYAILFVLTFPLSLALVPLLF
jgi:hypothetical protein